LALGKGDCFATGLTKTASLVNCYSNARECSKSCTVCKCL